MRCHWSQIVFEASDWSQLVFAQRHNFTNLLFGPAALLWFSCGLTGWGWWCAVNSSMKTPKPTTLYSAVLSAFTNQFLALRPKHRLPLKCKLSEKQSFVLKCWSLVSQIAGYLIYLFIYFYWSWVAKECVCWSSFSTVLKWQLWQLKGVGGTNLKTLCSVYIHVYEETYHPVHECCSLVFFFDSFCKSMQLYGTEEKRFTRRWPHSRKHIYWNLLTSRKMMQNKSKLFHQCRTCCKNMTNAQITCDTCTGVTHNQTCFNIILNCVCP